MRLSCLTITIAFVTLAPAIHGRNMGFTHGHNYTYTGPGGERLTYFPVAWDLRSTFFLMRDYLRFYQGLDEPEAVTGSEAFIQGLLLEAEEAGVNTVIIRIEPMMLQTHNTIRRAQQARALGLNVILGGMRNGGGNADEPGSHNYRVFQLWEECVSGSSGTGLPGHICGVFAHDEPDGHDLAYLPEVASAALRLHGSEGPPGQSSVHLPLGAALCRVGDTHLSRASIRSGPSSTPNAFGQVLDYISMNYYPAKVTASLHTLACPEIVSSHGHPTVFRGAADLVPSHGAFREAWCDRDEYCALTLDGELHVYTVEGGDEPGPVFFRLHSRQNIGIEPALRDYRVASSDTRSSDIGPRPWGSPELNGGMVFWIGNGPIGSARAVFWHDGGVRSREFPFSGPLGSKIFCVGELDYRSGWSTGTRCAGVIGSGEMRILWVGAPRSDLPGDTSWQAVVFRRDPSGELRECPSANPEGSITLPAGFHPVGGEWGYFWKDPSEHPHFRSGFILYTADGDYMVISTPACGSESWGATSAEPYRDLWGQGMVAGPVTVFRDNWNPPYTHMVRTHDRLIALAGPAHTSRNGTRVVWTSIGTSDPGRLPPPGSTPAPGLSAPDRLTRLGVYNQTHETGIRLFVTEDSPEGGSRTSISGFLRFPFEVDEIGFPSIGDWTVLSQLRSRHGRIPGPDVMLEKTAESLYIWAGRTETDSPGSGNPSIYFRNMFSRAAASEQEMGALDIMLEFGVNRSSSAECLFLTVQCFGRGCFNLTEFFPGDSVMGYDELTYIMGAALVHGVRGYNLYSLDTALFGGPSSGGPAATNRFPPELLFWGAGVDGPDDVDMVSRVHGVVRGFTRIMEADGLETDLLNVLVSREYSVMEESQAFNAGVHPEFPTRAVPFTEEPDLNFLAVRGADGDVLLLVSNDGAGDAAGDHIVLPDRSGETYSGYGPAEVLIGNREAASGHYCGNGDPAGFYLDLRGLGPQRFALIRLRAPGG